MEQARGRLLGHQRVDLGDGDRLPQGERRQQAGQAAGEHRLARAGRTQEEEVVPARGGHFEGPLGGLLATHLREVGTVPPDDAGERRRRDRRNGVHAGQVVDGLGQAAQADHRHGVESRRLRRVGRRQQHLARGEPPAEVGDGETAANGADGAVQTQLAADQPAVEGLLG